MCVGYRDLVERAPCNTWEPREYKEANFNTIQAALQYVAFRDFQDPHEVAYISVVEMAERNQLPRPEQLLEQINSARGTPA